MDFVKTSVARPTTIIITFALLILLSLFALMNLPVDLFPEINPPYIVVMTSYAGAGPGEVERSVTRVLEGSLSSVSNLEKVSSSSMKGYSTITLQFNYEADLMEAMNSIRDNLETVKRYLPEGAESPLIYRYDPSSAPIMALMVTGNRSPEELREIAEDMIAPRIEQTPGVAMATVTGGRDRVVRVELSANRLDAYKITVTELQGVLASQNIQLAAGSIMSGELSYILTTVGEYASLDDIRNAVISYKGGGYDEQGQVSLPRVVRVRDIANVFWGYRDEDSIVFVNGDPAIQISVKKQSGKNSVQTANTLRTRLDRIRNEIPAGIEIAEIYNTTDQIEASIDNVSSSAIQGAILAVAILFVFLRSVKPMLIIGASIPVSLLVTIMLMYFAGLTLNVMTLAGLALGVGMLVDNSIVILENVYHYREKGSSLNTAAILGTREMFLSIAGSTLTTVCVFAPLIMFQGLLEVVGELLSGVAFTVVISLAMSLVVAVTLIPVLSSRYLPLFTRKQKPLAGPLAVIDNAFERFFRRLDAAYRNKVDWALRHRKTVIFSLAALFILSILLVPSVGYVLMPSQAADSVTVGVKLPTGTPLHETEAVLKQLETVAEREIKGYERITILAGTSGSGDSGSLVISLPKAEKRIDSADDIKIKLRKHFNEFAGVSLSLEATNALGGNAIDVEIRTENLEKGRTTARNLAELIKKRIPEATEPQIDLQDGLPQIELRINRERLYALGLTVYSVGVEIRAAVDGVVASRYKGEGRDYDILLILAQADRDELPDLDRLYVKSPMTGQRVSLSNFVSYSKGAGPISINRENQSRVIHVTAGAMPGANLGGLREKLVSILTTEIPAEDGVVMNIAGDSAEMAKYMKNFALIVFVAILLVFGVMASLFESFKDPFIIFFTIPLSFIGIVAIYLITGEPFNILTAVGLLVLVGVIVNNGIVLVDYTNLLRKRGMPLHEACVEACANRLRPILMSTLTTILGLLPLAFFPGEGSELVAPIGKTVLGGISFGTLMTLFLMPVIYAVMNRNKSKASEETQ